MSEERKGKREYSQRNERNTFSRSKTTRSQSTGRKSEGYNERGDRKERSFGERKSFNKEGAARRIEEKGERSFDKKRSFSRDNDRPFTPRFGDKREKFNRDGEENNRGERSFGNRKPFSRDNGDRGERSFGNKNFDKKRSFSRDGEDRGERSFDKKRSFSRDGEDRGERSFDKKRSFSRDNGERGERSFDKKRSFSRDGEDRGERSFGNRSFDKKRSFSRDGEDRGERRNFDKSRSDRPKRSFSRDGGDKGDNKFTKRRDITAESAILSEIVERRRREGRPSQEKAKVLTLEEQEKYGPIRLNKFIANAGICSRRDADTLIESGAIQVNGEIITELGTKVNPTDEVRFEDRILQREKPVYLLLNKPKDYVTTTDDEFGRKHVLELVNNACEERIYPVGRLDKNTTGLLLFTNDGDMTKKLTHPRHEVQKTYAVELDRKLSAADFQMIEEGIELRDGMMHVDEIVYLNETRKELGVTIHSGKNRIVRRLFEHLGYEVEKLDRVIFANLTKKDLPRGKWRFLTDAEVNILKMIKFTESY